MASIFRKRKNQAAPAPQVPDRKTRREELLAALRDIDLQKPRNQLSQDTIERLDIARAIECVVSTLSEEASAGVDSPVLDSNTLFLIHALHNAILEGLEETARVACTALVMSVNELLCEIPPVDREYAGELMQSREEYSVNLRLLVQLVREHDLTDDELTSQNDRLRLKRMERDNLVMDIRDRLKRRRQAPEPVDLELELDEMVAEPVELRSELNAMIFEPDELIFDPDPELGKRVSEPVDLKSELKELEKRLRDPVKMSSEDLQLREDLLRVDRLSESIEGLVTGTEVNRARLATLSRQIEFYYNILVTRPRVTDKTLQTRVDETARRYASRLNATVAEAERDVGQMALKPLRAELLRERDNSQKLQEENAWLRSQVAELRKKNEELRDHLQMLTGVMNMQKQEETMKQIFFHSRPEDMSMEDLTDIDDL